MAVVAPDTLAREASRPQASLRLGSAQQGLGWLLSERLELIASAGAGPGASASLLIRAGPIVRFEFMAASTVTLVRSDPRLTAVVAQTTTWQEFPTLWSQLLDEVYAFVGGNHGLAAQGDDTPKWRNVMLYKDDKPSVEVGVLAPRPFKPEGRVIASQLPGGQTAMATHHGDYARLGRTHDAVRHFVEAEGLELAGPRWEIYGHWRDDPSELETEIYYLVR